jgi:translation elongation factor EF-Tu-like GTPase
VVPEVEVEIKFLSFEEGGRQFNYPISLDGYRPHFRINNDSELFGVMFKDLYLNVPKEKVIAKVSLVYYPLVDYKNLIKEKEFMILEGNKVVGNGRIISSSLFDE